MIVLARETQGNSDYDGSHDHHREVWLTDEFLKGRYAEYNRRFFDGRLPQKVAVLVWEGQRNVSALGLTWTDFYDFIDKRFLEGDEIDSCDETSVEVQVPRILIRKVLWASRYQLENALVHEMCHVYQIYTVLKQNPRVYLAEHKLYKAHGASFSEAAMKVNLSKDNHNNEQFFVSSGAFKDAIEEGRRFHHILGLIHNRLERHLRISTQMRYTLASYGCYVENRQVTYSHKLIHECRM